MGRRVGGQAVPCIVADDTAAMTRILESPLLRQATGRWRPAPTPPPHTAGCSTRRTSSQSAGQPSPAPPTLCWRRCWSMPSRCTSGTGTWPQSTPQPPHARACRHSVPLTTRCAHRRSSGSRQAGRHARHVHAHQRHISPLMHAVPKCALPYTHMQQSPVPPIPTTPHGPEPDMPHPWISRPNFTATPVSPHR